MVASNSVRKIIIDYVTKRASISDLDAWLARNTWDMHLDSSPDSQQLVGDVELRISEFGMGAITEEELRGELLKLLGRDYT